MATLVDIARPKYVVTLVVISVCSFGSFVSMLGFVFTSRAVPSELVAEPAAWDLGMVGQGSSAQATFVLRNQSPHSITILNVSTGCGCASPVLSSSRIDRQSTGSLAVTFNSGTARGAIRLPVDVTYTVGLEPRVKRLVLLVTGSIVPEYSVSPEQLDFNAGVTSTRQITLVSRHGPPLRVTNALSDKRFVYATVVDDRPSNAVVVDVTLDSAKYYTDAGPASLLVYTDNNVAPVVRIPITIGDSSARQ